MLLATRDALRARIFSWRPDALATKPQILWQIIPVRCFTCGKVIGNKWITYLDLLHGGNDESEAFVALGLTLVFLRSLFTGQNGNPA